MNDNSDKLFVARLSDLADESRRTSVYAYTSFFLDERQCAVAEAWCKKNTGELYSMLWGGFPDARRKMLAIYPDYCEDYVQEDFPFVCLTFTYRKEDRLTHRDFLGSFMGMQLKRETVGDIVVSEGETQAFFTETAAKLIKATVGKIGRTGVKVSDDRPFELEVRQEYKKIIGTVASLRLDCIVSLAAHISRENATGLIRSDKVDVNHFTASSISQELREGDIISVRGSGRYILSAVNGLSGKGRIHVEVLKYI